MTAKTTITLHGFAESSYVQTVHLLCQEKGIAYETTISSIQEWATNPEARKSVPHPFGKIPVLDDGDVRLFETTAICHYLDEKAGGPSLFGDDLISRAQIEQWVSAVNSYYDGPLIRRYVLTYVAAKYFGQELDRAKIDAVLPELREKLATLDAAYGARDYLVGDDLTAADLMLAPMIRYLSMMPEGPELLEAVPNVRRAQARQAERESFQQVLPAAAV